MLARIPPDRLVDILDIAEDGIVTVDARQEVVLFNRGAAKIFGYTPDEVVGQSLDLLIPERYREAHGNLVTDFGRSPGTARLMGERREVYGRRKDGSEFPAEVSISKFDSGTELLFTAIVRDVTERKRFEAARRELDQLRAKAEVAESQARLDAVIQSAQDAVVIVDADRRVTLFNPAAERVFGCPVADALGADLAQFLPDGLPSGTIGPTAPLETDGRRADGIIVPLEVSVSRVEVAGQVIHTLILRDMSERKRTLAELKATTQQLWQAARLAGVGELAASIAHELNNPLGTVSLRVERLLSRTSPGDPNHQALEVVSQEVERMGRLVANLLQFSRAGRDQVSTVDVCEEVGRTVELIDHHLRKRQIRVEPEFALDVPVIYADRQQLRQVFLNLFTNAADAMSGGGRLTPRVKLGELPVARPAVVVEVADTGAGIPADLLPRVCDPFFTTKEDGKGTGLGLAICKRIVEQHDGALDIESAEGAGTTIRVTLPVRTDKNVAGLDLD